MKPITNEQQLFDYLKENKLPDLVMAKDKFSRWDCYSPDTKVRAELKCRSKDFDAYIIEKDKYEILIRKCSDNGDIPVYINSSPKGVYYWVLDKLPEPKWLELPLPVTSQFADNRKVTKTVGFLSVQNATVVVRY